MRHALLDHLSCPACSVSPLRMTVFEAADAGAIVTGILHCSGCGRWYPVQQGIPCLMPDDLRSADEACFLDHWRHQLPDDIRGGCGPPGTGGKPARSATTREIELRDREAELYDSLYPDDKFRAELETYRAMLQPSAGDLVLDLGCGTGRITRQYLASGAQLVGVDVSHASLCYFRSKLEKRWHERLDLVQADITRLPFQAGQFDSIVSASVICFLPEKAARDRALHNAATVLREDGVLLISTYNYCLLKRVRGFLGVAHTGRKEGRSRGGGTYYNYSTGEFLTLLRTGFEIESVRGIDNRIPVLHRLSAGLNAWLDRVISATPLALPVFSREMLVRAVKR